MKTSKDGHLTSLDNDIMFSINKGITPLSALKLRIIKISIRDYLYFGLGDNGITPESFLDAYQYLFIKRSENEFIPSLRDKCFDIHFTSSSISDNIDLTSFTNKLRTKRGQLVSSNIINIKKNIRKNRDREWKTSKGKGKKKAYNINHNQMIGLLCNPCDECSFAKLMLYEKPVTISTPKSMLKYKSILF